MRTSRAQASRFTTFRLRSSLCLATSPRLISPLLSISISMQINFNLNLTCSLSVSSFKNQKKGKRVSGRRNGHILQLKLYVARFYDTLDSLRLQFLFHFSFDISHFIIFHFFSDFNLFYGRENAIMFSRVKKFFLLLFFFFSYSTKARVFLFFFFNTVRRPFNKTGTNCRC